MGVKADQAPPPISIGANNATNKAHHGPVGFLRVPLRVTASWIRFRSRVVFLLVSLLNHAERTHPNGLNWANGCVSKRGCPYKRSLTCCFLPKMIVPWTPPESLCSFPCRALCFFSRPRKGRTVLACAGGSHRRSAVDEVCRRLIGRFGTGFWTFPIWVG